ncbi:hypothetical protein IGI04_006510 [Brassica rapa subsp. trilocularis]|uniref:Uncharacterized protein n=1 Tax=Brassica rapa subsp. trilocularis TaxID=1813537 RepID=A0ABQ7NH36_BRACM|nr:hypothetical protein IGI04_006510 [Brassica rapa subsp. trilocularis]
MDVTLMISLIPVIFLGAYLAVHKIINKVVVRKVVRKHKSSSDTNTSKSSSDTNTSTYKIPSTTPTSQETAIDNLTYIGLYTCSWIWKITMTDCDIDYLA